MKYKAKADGDLISRTELLKALDSWDKFGVDDTNSLFRLDNLSLPHYVPYIHYDDVVKCIKGMPKAEQEPQTWHWINGFCSKCGKEAITEWNDTGGELCLSDYCPHCGAKMD